MKHFYKILFALLCAHVYTSAVAMDAAAKVALVGGTVIDLDGGKPLQDAVVLIDGERISAIGSSKDVSIAPGTEVIDVRNTWLIPGLMNMHVHLGLVFPGKNGAELASETEGELVLRMAHNARQTLQAGITTIRLTGSEKRGDIAVRKAIEQGHADGPRIFSCGQPVVITGGHGSEHGVAYNDGPYEVAKAARLEISSGASWVKILISGGIATQGGDISEALMTPEEIAAAIDAAHRFGAKVAAHSGSTAATTVAVDAGVDSIEHGYFLDRAVLQKMKKRGTWLVPTMVVTQPASRPNYEALSVPEWFLKRFETTGQAHWKVVKMAIEEGVNVALGTDWLPAEPNDGTIATVREAEYYVAAGMTPLQALRAATIEPARMLRADGEIGSLKVGKLADIVIVDKDPTDDIKALRQILFVMKGGHVYRNDIGKK